MRRLRWRLARWIAPVPILMAPSGEGPAILMSHDKGYAAWLRPKTLDVSIENRLPPRAFDLENPRFEPSGPTGTITGTIG